MSQISGQTNATFAIDRSTYYSNQTVCMGFSKSEQRWSSQLCRSELHIDDVAMKCTCNAFDSDQIGVFSDFTRELGETVVFPEIEILVETAQLTPTRISQEAVDKSKPS